MVQRVFPLIYPKNLKCGNKKKRCVKNQKTALQSSTDLLKNAGSEKKKNTKKTQKVSQGENNRNFSQTK